MVLINYFEVVFVHRLAHNLRSSTSLVTSITVTINELITCLIHLGDNTKTETEETISEILKMESLSHPNVMSLIGVSITDTMRIVIIMPYMANGSLLSYIKKERTNLYLDFDVDEDEVRTTCNLINWQLCP